MTKKLEICFIPKNTDNTQYICLLCEYTADLTNMVGYSNHIKYKHVSTGDIPSLIDYFYKCISDKDIIKSIGKCKTCNNPTEFVSLIRGYKPHCSHQCSVDDPSVKEKSIKNARNTLFEKYGVHNASQIPGHKEKSKATKKQRYGDENYNNLEQVRKTNIEKYGVPNYAQTKEYKNKATETSKEKYGVEHFTQSTIVKDKIKKTCLEKYGVEHALQFPTIRERIRETVESRGGWTLEKEENRQKCKVAIRKKTESRIENYKIVFDNVEIISVMDGTFRCKVCLKEFTLETVGTSRSQPRNYPRCKECFPLGKQNKCSLFHQEVLGFLNSDLQIPLDSIKENSKEILNPGKKEIDLFIQDKNFAIELNGNFWHTENFGGKTKEYHLEKTNICSSKGVTLLHIFEDEWENKKGIVKQKIAHLLKKNNMPSIFARKCEIIKISAKECNKFLEDNHIQGSETNSTIRLGAFYNNKLVAAMTFGKPRLHMGGKSMLKIAEHTYELIRFATDINFRIVGIGSKLFQHFVTTINPEIVYSYADKRWTSSVNGGSGSIYDKLGFMVASHSSPNYFYVHPSTSYKFRENRFRYRKSELPKQLREFIPELTEWENMKLNGYDRIWDCGTIKYIWHKQNGKNKEDQQLGSNDSNGLAII